MSKVWAESNTDDSHTSERRSTFQGPLWLYFSPNSGCRPALWLFDTRTSFWAQDRTFFQLWARSSWFLCLGPTFLESLHPSDVLTVWSSSLIQTCFPTTNRMASKSCTGSKVTCGKKLMNGFLLGWRHERTSRTTNQQTASSLLPNLMQLQIQTGAASSLHHPSISSSGLSYLQVLFSSLQLQSPDVSVIGEFFFSKTKAKNFFSRLFKSRLDKCPL